MFTPKYLCWSLFLIKNFKTTLLKKTPTQVFSCEYCGIFKINCFEEHLRTAVSIRCYFDRISLKQSGFFTTYSFKILVSEQSYKNNVKNCESKKKIFTILMYIMFVECFITKSRGFTKISMVKICAF